MPDVFTKAKRSEVMSRIRSRGNRETELALARLFRRQGITGWRRHVQIRSAERGTRNGNSSRPVPRRGEGLRVRPDFVFPRLNVAVFVDGCFWHGCPRHSPPARWLRRSAMPAVARQDAKTPRTGKRFWRQKLAANMARDRRVNRALRAAGWRVVRIWEHQLSERGTGNAERGTLQTERGTALGQRGMRSAECGTARLVAKLRRSVR